MYGSIGGIAAYSAPDLKAMGLGKDHLHLDMDQPRDPKTGAVLKKSVGGTSPVGGAALEESPDATALKALRVRISKILEYKMKKKQFLKFFFKDKF